MKKQPAKINYFFKDGYRDFGRTFVETFRRCGEVISNSWRQVRDSFDEMRDYAMDVLEMYEPFESFFKAIGHAFVFGFAVGRLILSTLITPVLCTIISLVQAVVLLTCMFIFYVFFLIVAFFDWLYRSIKKISTSCPQCQEKHSLPTYVCLCGAKHTMLAPSKYGVFVRTCECGRKLKTTFFNGRHKQPGKWICPKCGYELGGPLQVDIPIPVVGGPSAGKTCYISMAISQLEKNSMSRYKLAFQYKPNDALGDDYEENKRYMAGGRVPYKTTESRLKYYQFYLTPKGEKVRNLISFCDVAGEAYSSTDEVGRQIGFKYANAFLMVLDPLSIKMYREELASTIDLKKYKPSEGSMDEILDLLIKTLENMKCLTPQNMIKTDVAVVFSKCDIPGLEEKIGATAVKKYMQHNKVKSKFEATNRVCEQFLMDYEEDNFLNSLKSKFKSIQFFTCSALGHVEDGSSFIPDGVEEPALWLIDKASASINLKNKWGKKI